jgi:flavodoxin
MNIGIILYSHTGKTLSVAERLVKAAKNQGHRVGIEPIQIAPNDPNVADSVLISAPSPLPYDRLVLASPVHGFRMSRAMKLYLEQLPNLNGRKIACFVTHYFPFAWMGGSGSVKGMAEAVAAKSGSVVFTGVVNWKNKKREQGIESMISALLTALAGE